MADDSSDTTKRPEALRAVKKDAESTRIPLSSFPGVILLHYLLSVSCQEC